MLAAGLAMAAMLAAGPPKSDKLLCENPADDRVVRALGAIYLNCTTARARAHSASGDPPPSIAGAAITACAPDRESLVKAFQECRVRDGDAPSEAERVVKATMVGADAWVRTKALEAASAKRPHRRH